ncbi:PASTA domain-containing protein [Nonomuraea sp. NBC_01738]|uniref:PASTA domain-containing protein n=1 Tax=Nonomuraea sp. NBC_01738 TaxID=2976003 RepID=UPI003FA3DD08|nr:PASTA domain-containing protein [Nonomuraea sp. NBC_01738]
MSAPGGVPEVFGTGEPPDPGETQDVRRGWRGHAANRVGLAVSCALLVSAGVLVAVLVPALRQEEPPPLAAPPPVTISTPTQSPPRPSDSSTQRGRRAPTTTPPAPPAANVTIPALIGLDRAAALTSLKKAGLLPGTITEIDAKQPIGAVLATRPAPGATVTKGAKVDLDVSAGLPVPALTGMTRKVAEAALTTSGLAAGPIERVCSAEPAGRVLSTSPGAGKRVQAGAQVTLVVSRKGTKIPSVVGMSREEAGAALREAGFAVRQKPKAVDDPQSYDKVLTQSLGAGTCAAQGATVTLTIGVAPQTGPDPGEPPPDTPDPTPPADTPPP